MPQVTLPVVPDPTDITKTGGNLDNPGFSGAVGNPIVEAGSTIVAVTDKSLASNVATLVVGAHPFVAGDSVIVSIGDAIFDGTFTVTAKTSTSISYAKTHADVSSPAAQTITNKKIANFIATLTFSANAFAVGDVVTVTGLTGFNGNYVVQAKSATTISFVIGAADVASASASGTVTRISQLGTVENALRNERFITPNAPQVRPAASTVALFDTDKGVIG